MRFYILGEAVGSVAGNDNYISKYCKPINHSACWGDTLVLCLLHSTHLCSQHARYKQGVEYTYTYLTLCYHKDIKCQGLFFCVHAPDCLCRCMSEVLFALNCTFVSHGNVQPKYRGQSMACHCLSCTFRLWQQLTWQVLESLYRKMINPTQLAISTTVHIQRKIAKAKLVVFTNSLAFPYISNE